ncbi:hypothetical protein R1sor_022764 [Riccia sorocarpa]|uniref:Uncharacterized protein n=1 Tax=Riccia sorocarpa TaxID=122646 RepID=A0ABD3GLI1_9MARC
MSVWKERDSRKPYYELAEALGPDENIVSNWHGVPIAAAPIVISLPPEVTDNLFADTYNDKLVLSFQGKLNELEAREWLQTTPVQRDSGHENIVGRGIQNTHGRSIPPSEVPAPRYIPPGRSVTTAARGEPRITFTTAGILPLPTQGAPLTGGKQASQHNGSTSQLKPKPHIYKTYAALKPARPSIAGGFISPARAIEKPSPRNTGRERYERTRPQHDGTTASSSARPPNHRGPARDGNGNRSTRDSQ